MYVFLFMVQLNNFTQWMYSSKHFTTKPKLNQKQNKWPWRKMCPLLAPYSVNLNPGSDSSPKI